MHMASFSQRLWQCICEVEVVLWSVFSTQVFLSSNISQSASSTHINCRENNLIWLAVDFESFYRTTFSLMHWDYAYQERCKKRNERHQICHFRKLPRSLHFWRKLRLRIHRFVLLMKHTHSHFEHRPVFRTFQQCNHLGIYKHLQHRMFDFIYTNRFVSVLRRFK